MRLRRGRREYLNGFHICARNLEKENRILIQKMEVSVVSAFRQVGVDSDEAANFAYVGGSPGGI